MTAKFPYMLRVLVTGGKGQLGQCFQEQAKQYLDWSFFFPAKEKVNITHLDSLEDFVQKNQINAIINTAAYTQVDQAETEPEKAFLSNETGVKNLLKIAEKRQLKILFFSTDYVFNKLNRDFYTESDTVSPKGVYAESKAAGEALIGASNTPTVLIRTSWLYSIYGKNFVKTILKLGASDQEIKVVNDQWGSPTYGSDLAALSLQILDRYPSQSEIFHMANTGVTNWYSFAKKILKKASINKKIKGISTVDYGALAPRPNHSVLDSSKIQSYLECKIRSWEEALEECLNQLLNE